MFSQLYDKADFQQNLQLHLQAETSKAKPDGSHTQLRVSKPSYSSQVQLLRPELRNTNSQFHLKPSVSGLQSGKQIQSYLAALSLQPMYNLSARSLASMAPSTKIGYLDLPREIRDQIMDLVLHPGEVHIYPNPESLEESLFIDGRYVSHQRYGVQLLATCRQVYEEGYRIWYGKNTFHISTCTFDDMKHVLGAHQKKHLGMIAKLVVECTIHDVPNTLIDRLSGNVTEMWEARSPVLDDAGARVKRYINGDFKKGLAAAVRQEWRAKSFWLRANVPNGHRMLVRQVALSNSAGLPLRCEFVFKDGLEATLMVSNMKMAMGTTMAKGIEKTVIFAAIERTLTWLRVEQVVLPC